MIAALRGADFIGPGPRSPTPGGPYTYMTTRHFLAAFDMATLRDLPDIQACRPARSTLTSPKSAFVLEMDASYR